MSASTAISQFLTFTLEKEIYAVDVSMVKEVLEYTQITKVPRMPDFMRGVINLRGSVVPVIDLRLKFCMPEEEPTIDTSIVVTEITLNDEMVVMGVLTDSVNEVLEITEAQVDPPPRIGTKVDTDFIKGIGRKNDDFIIILNIEKILTTEDIISIADVDEQQASGEESEAADSQEKSQELSKEAPESPESAASE